MPAFSIAIYGNFYKKKLFYKNESNFGCLEVSKVEIIKDIYRFIHFMELFQVNYSRLNKEKKKSKLS